HYRPSTNTCVSCFHVGALQLLCAYLVSGAGPLPLPSFLVSNRRERYKESVSRKRAESLLRCPAPPLTPQRRSTPQGRPALVSGFVEQKTQPGLRCCEVGHCTLLQA